MKKLLLVFITITGLLLMNSCLKDENPAGTGMSGSLMVKITDDPFNIDLVSSAEITVSKIEIRKKDTADEAAFIVLKDVPFTVDLLKLRNGVTEELVNLDIPAGKYDLIRLYVTQARLTLKDNSTPFTVKVPSGEQTGIKIFIAPEIDVEGGLTSELLLDMDLSKSFVMRGNLTVPSKVESFIFKPTVRAVNLSLAGRIEGKVTDINSLPVNNAKVWVTKDTVISSAFTDTTGYYAFLGIPSGTYSLSVFKDGYDTVSVSGLKVYSGNRTTQNFQIPF